MSLTKISLGTLVKKQYQFKLRAYSGIYSTLIILQLIGMFFSVIAGNSFGTGSSNITIHVTYFSADQVIIYTMIWAFISAILVTTRAYREDDFTFVTNRVSNNLANAFVLITASVIGGVTAYLSGFLIKIIVRLAFNNDYLPGSDIPPTSLELISDITFVILVLFLLSALGYLIGMIVQLHKVFVVVLPVSFIGFLYLSEKLGERNLSLQIFEFYFKESFVLLFILKVAITSVLLLIGATYISNRQEVRL